MRIDVIIPVYHPGERFLESLRRLCRQTRPVNRFIIMNTEQELWEAWEKRASCRDASGKPFGLSCDQRGVRPRRDQAPGDGAFPGGTVRLHDP